MRTVYVKEDVTNGYRGFELAYYNYIWYAFTQKMKTISGLLLIFVLVQFVFPNSTYPLEIKERNEYLVDIRNGDGNLYLNRLSFHKKIDRPDMEVSGFAEAQWNFETDEWEKLILGMEAVKSLWQYLYISQSFQLVSGQILDHMVFDTDSKSIDATTKIGLLLPLLKDLSLRFFEEYSFNLIKGKDEYNEIGAEMIYDFKDLLSISIGWRHTDRIHNFDTDYATSALTLHF